jgi:hypothetical protein
MMARDSAPPWAKDPRFLALQREWEAKLVAEGLEPTRPDDHEARRAQRGAEQLALEASIQETHWTNERQWSSRGERIRWVLATGEGWRVTEIKRLSCVAPRTLLTEQQHIAAERKRCRQKRETDDE